MHVIIVGIICCLKSPYFLTLGTHVDIALKNRYDLHVISLEFTGKSPQILQGYPRKFYRETL
jgi:hypothetical protein